MSMPDYSYFALPLSAVNEIPEIKHEVMHLMGLYKNDPRTMNEIFDSEEMDGLEVDVSLTNGILQIAGYRNVATGYVSITSQCRFFSIAYNAFFEAYENNYFSTMYWYRPGMKNEQEAFYSQEDAMTNISKIRSVIDSQNEFFTGDQVLDALIAYLNRNDYISHDNHIERFAQRSGISMNYIV